MRKQQKILIKKNSSKEDILHQGKFEVLVNERNDLIRNSIVDIAFRAYILISDVVSIFNPSKRKLITGVN